MSTVLESAHRMAQALNNVVSLKTLLLDSATVEAVFREAGAAREAYLQAVAQSSVDACPEDNTPAAETFDAIVAHLRQRIVDGDLDAEDIPMRMVRYGMTDPHVFVAEMLERIEMSQVD